MLRSLSALGLIVAPAIAVAGCGGGGSSTASTASTAATATPGTAGGPTTTSPAQKSSTASSAPTTATAPSGTGSAGSAAAGSANGGGATNANGAPLGANTAKPGQGDNSVQTYGAAAQGKDKAAVIAAMRSFMGAMASFDYPKLCTLFRSQVRAGLTQFAKAGQGKSCAALLPKLLPRSKAQAQAARKAQAAPIIAVRIGGGNAFVIFKPQGGPTSFFVMKLEGGAWKAIGVGTGTPLVPSSG